MLSQSSENRSTSLNIDDQQCFPSEQDSNWLIQEKLASKKTRVYLSETERKGNGYSWNTEENAKYLKFLQTNAHLFSLDLKQKKKMKIHFLMSKCIKTRNSLQCRSHHQKMEKKYGDIENVIKKMTSLLPSARQSKQLLKKDCLPAEVAHQIPEIELVNYTERQFEEGKECSIWDGALKEAQGWSSGDFLF